MIMCGDVILVYNVSPADAPIRYVSCKGVYHSTLLLSAISSIHVSRSP